MSEVSFPKYSLPSVIRQTGDNLDSKITLGFLGRFGLRMQELGCDEGLIRILIRGFLKFSDQFTKTINQLIHQLTH